MNMKRNPLAYNIADWSQATTCLSNNSKYLHISVGDITYEQHLTGKVLQVHHDKLGILFATLIDASGTMLTESSLHKYHQLSTEEICKELYKFGFIIYFNKMKHLSAAQLSYLMTLRDLKFDKLRKLMVLDKGTKTSGKECIVAFNVTENPNWLNNNYVCGYDEFAESLNNGSAINLTNISKTLDFNWDWLDFIANIDDVLKENE